MKSAICICSMITALLVVFGCFMGVDYLGLRVNESLPVLAPVETITDVTTIFAKPISDASFDKICTEFSSASLSAII